MGPFKFSLYILLIIILEGFLIIDAKNELLRIYSLESQRQSYNPNSKFNLNQRNLYKLHFKFISLFILVKYLCILFINIAIVSNLPFEHNKLILRC